MFMLVLRLTLILLLYADYYCRVTILIIKSKKTVMFEMIIKKVIELKMIRNPHLHHLHYLACPDC